MTTRILNFFLVHGFTNHEETIGDTVSKVLKKTKSAVSDEVQNIKETFTMDDIFNPVSEPQPGFQESYTSHLDFQPEIQKQKSVKLENAPQNLMFEPELQDVNILEHYHWWSFVRDNFSEKCISIQFVKNNGTKNGE